MTDGQLAQALAQLGCSVAIAGNEDLALRLAQLEISEDNADMADTQTKSSDKKDKDKTSQKSKNKEQQENGKGKSLVNERLARVWLATPDAETCAKPTFTLVSLIFVVLCFLLYFYSLFNLV